MMHCAQLNKKHRIQIYGFRTTKPHKTRKSEPRPLQVYLAGARSLKREIGAAAMAVARTAMGKSLETPASPPEWNGVPRAAAASVVAAPGAGTPRNATIAASKGACLDQEGSLLCTQASDAPGTTIPSSN